MREILFKGKRKDNGEWVEGILFDNEVIVPQNQEILIFENRLGSNIRCHLVFSETVGQYTGLTDKNGKKIFEGDIIRYADECEYRIYLESLEYPEEYEGIDFCDLWTIDSVVYGIEIGYPAFDLNNHEWECNGLYNLKQYFFEVIGNIHDNSELLGGAE